MAYFLNPKERKDLINIFSKWRSENKISYSIPGYWVSALISSTMIPFDMLFFPKTYTFYLPYRLCMMFFFLFMGFFSKKMGNKDQKKMSELWKSLIMLTMPAVWAVTYIYFLHHSYSSIDQAESSVVLIGNVMAAIFPMIFIYKFWREVYVFQSLNILTISLGIAVNLYKLDPGINHVDGLLLIVAHMCSCFFCVAMRRNFASDLYNRYLNVKGFVPANIASEIVASGHDQDIGKKYFPEKRFTVCLCSDWRGSQKLSEHLDSVKITEAFETYYDLAFSKLADIVPDNNYYASWYSDELMIFFFGDKSENDKNVAINNCINFLKYFSFDFVSDIKNKIGFKINFDIGISCGIDLLGLQGPQFNKKTTLIGKTPGVAKRNETEAKSLREKYFNGEGPIVVFQEEFFNYSKNLLDFENKNIQKMMAQGKNIEGGVIYVLNAGEQYMLQKKAA